MENFQKIAVLIDADNTQLSKLEAVLHEVSAYGRIVVKKAYGNWRKDSLKNWEPELKRLAIRAVSATALFSFPHVPLVRILHHDPPLGSQAPFSDIAEIW